MFDIVFNFRTSYVNSKNGEEIMDPKIVAIEYVKTRFWIDLVASIPFDQLMLLFTDDKGNSIAFQCISLLKLVRVLRLSRLITHLNLENEIKTSLRLMKLFFFILLYLHLLACVWYYIVKENEEWIPPLDYVFIVTDVYDRSKYYQYFMSLYHAVLMLGGNDIGPRGNFQLIFVSVILMLGAVITSIIFGNMSVMLQSLNRKSTAFQEKLENANEAMKNLKISDEIREEVEYFLSFTQNALDQQKELDSFLSMLSPSLRQKVTGHVFKGVMMINPIFKNKPDMYSTVMNYLQIKLFMPEEEVARQNDIGEEMFFISNGKCDVYVTDNHKV